MSIYKIRVRRDTSGRWTFVNPVLGIGEVGFETNTRKLKVGDGTTPWNSLSYVAYEVSAHDQAISTITGLQAALDNKAALSHSHAISDVATLQTALDGKAALSHSHAFIDVTGLQAALDNKSDVGHGHTISDITALQGALDFKAAYDHTHTHEEVTATGFGREVIFNTSGLFDASPEFQYDRTTSHLIVAGTIESSGVMTAREFYGDLLGAVHAPVKNTSGGAIGKGVPVYITGTVGATTTLEVAIARADDSSKMPAVGILVQELSSNATGHVSILGTTPNMDTSAFSVGQTVYVGPTGGLVNTRPTGVAILVQNIGKVGRVNSNNGEIIVTGPGRTNDVPNNLSLDSLYDVESSGASSGQVLLYNGSIWTYGTVTGGGGGSPGGSDTYVQFNDSGSFGGDSGLTYNKTTDSLTIAGDLAVNGSDITTTSTGTATVFSSNALNANAFLAASGITVGSSVGTLFVNNTQTALSGDLSLGVPRITTSSTGTAFVFNGSATTLNIGGAATTVNIGATAGTTATIRGGTLSGNTTTQNVFNTAATVINAFGAATGLTIGSATGLAHIRNNNLRLGDTTAIIVTNAGDSNSLTIQPFGNLTLSPFSTTLNGGDLPALVITNSDDAAGQVQITGGDLYLGAKNDSAENETPCNIIFEGTVDANELTLTVASLTADRTVTLPDLTGTVALVAGASGQIQFNNGYTALGGSSNLLFDGSNLTIGSQGDIRLSDSDSSNYVGFQSPATVNSNTIWTLPTGDGTGAQVLSTNGSGVLYWGGGGISRIISNVSGTTNAGSSASTDYVYNAVSGSFTITLPTAVSNTNRYTMKQSSTGVLTIATTSSQTIDGSTTYSLSKQYQAVDILSDGSNWFLV